MLTIVQMIKQAAVAPIVQQSVQALSIGARRAVMRPQTAAELVSRALKLAGGDKAKAERILQRMGSNSDIIRRKLQRYAQELLGRKAALSKPITTAAKRAPVSTATTAGSSGALGKPITTAAKRAPVSTATTAGSSGALGKTPPAPVTPMAKETPKQLAHNTKILDKLKKEIAIDEAASAARRQASYDRSKFYPGKYS